MEFQLESTDGLAQKGTLCHQGDKITTPNIIFVSTDSIPIHHDAFLYLVDKTNDFCKPTYHMLVNNMQRNQEKKILCTIEKPLFYPKSCQKNSMRPFINHILSMKKTRMFSLEKFQKSIKICHKPYDYSS